MIKADGLAAGKGVVIAADEAEARAALEEMLVERRFGDAPVLVEEFLDGEELSLLALCDGERAVPLAPARDYKRIGDGDTGPEHGRHGRLLAGRRASARTRVAEIVATVHQPVVDELARRGTPFHGVLYAGLMLTADGAKVLEFNVRFGDPETQAVLPRLRSDLLDLLERATAARRPRGRRARVGSARGGDRRARLARATRRAPSNGRRDHRPRRACAAGVEVIHAGTAERDGDDRHRRRPRAQRDRARRRRRQPPAPPPMLPPT